MSDFLNTPIEYLKGVGPQRAKLLQSELGIYTYHQLLNHFPFRYIDRTQYQSIAEAIQSEQLVQLKGKIHAVQEQKIGKKSRLIIQFVDESGIIDLIWYQGYQYLLPKLTDKSQTFQVFGKPKRYGAKVSISHPEITPFNEIDSQIGWQAVYSTTEKLTNVGLNSKGIQKIVATCIELFKNHPLTENLPDYLMDNYRLLDRKTALVSIHQPDQVELASKARYRFKLEELLVLQLELLLRRAISLNKTAGHKISEIGESFINFYNNHLPFDLTNAQKKVIKEIRKDLGSGHQMNRLLQGDVGSGKTVVALLTLLMGIDSGLQGALMAPTEILANQHYIGLKELLKDTPVRVELLTGSSKTKARRTIHTDLLLGEIHILVGTHALLEDIVQFKNLGIVVIDEQHRFGVAQRARLWKKNVIPPHVLVMTATPIPRTLAMTFYGDLDVSVIDELPPGRKPISTLHYTEKDRLKLFGFIKKEIELGRQIYIVYPLIEESESMDYANLMDGFTAISKTFPLPHYAVSIVNGRMKAEDKEYEMQRFIRNETQIMVATTVIEVGVNVPNASVMIIESSERFGLSQLHQLRGRVGRGAEKSYCILMTGEKLSNDSKKRVSTMVRTTDGFEIAEVDLELRGPGDIMGTQQSGTIDLKIADLSKDGQLVAMARDIARSILKEDPRLERNEHEWFKTTLIKRLTDKPNWAEIS
ncbi:MAG: ATP-dependent DNA helicase RecG [Fluviicola sp.]